MYDKNTLEEHNRKKNREILGIFDEDDFYRSRNKKKEDEELKECTFKPIINKNSYKRKKESNLKLNTEPKNETFNRLYEVMNVCFEITFIPKFKKYFK